MNLKSIRSTSTFFRLFTPIAFAMTLASCQPVESEDIKTSGIYADIEVVSTSSRNADVNVSFRSSNLINASYIELTNNDSLIASSGSTDKELIGSNSFTKTDYSTSFESLINGAIINISLVRPNDVNAPNSFVTMPEDIEITSPTNSPNLNLGDSLTLTWSSNNPLNGTVDIIYNVQCITGFTTPYYSQKDDGLFTVQINDLIINKVSYNQGSSCNIAITLARVNTGNIDPNYGKNGKIVGIVQRSAVVFVTP